MHATEREEAILKLLGKRGFLSFRDLEKQMDASPATLRRDLERMAGDGLVERIRGGVKAVVSKAEKSSNLMLEGALFAENITRNRVQKEAIGKAAAALCKPDEGVMIDGGSTTLQMCRHLDGLNLQVLTNSLHIVNALLPQSGTRVLVPGGSVFREQNIILSAAGDDLMPRFHAPKLFMGAAALGPHGVMQADVVLVAAERRLISRAEEVILLVDSSKFQGYSGNVVCALEEIDIVVTDAKIKPDHVKMLKSAGVQLVIA